MGLIAGLPDGVTMQRSALGGFAVYVGGKFVGWIHESGEKWNAYLRMKDEPGRPLGRFDQIDAILRVAHEAGWPGPVSEPAYRECPG